MKTMKMILAVCFVSSFTLACGSDGANGNQPIDSTNSIVLPEGRTSDSIPVSGGSSAIIDSSDKKMDSMVPNGRSKKDSAR